MFIWIVFKWKWNGNIVIQIIIIPDGTNSFNLFHVSLIDQSFLILWYKERNLKYVKCQILIPYYLAEIFSDEIVSQRFKNIKNIMIALTKK